MRSHRTSLSSVLALALWLATQTGCASVLVEPPVPEAQTDLRQAMAKRDVGMDHLSKGRSALAIRDLMAAERLNPDDHETHLWLGEAYRRRAMLERAEAHTLRAMDLKPESQAARLNLSALYLQMERYEDAIRETDLLIEDPTFPTPWRALTNRGWAEYKLGDLAVARATFDLALEYNPRYAPAILNLGIVHADVGRRLDALELFQQVLAETENPYVRAEANYRIGETFVSLGRRDRAIRHFANAVEQAPYGIWGERSKEYMKLLR